MSDEVIMKLRAELERVRGPARIGPLSRLATALAERYWRTGPGLPEGLPDLNAAIAALEEAYGYFGDGDGLRGQHAYLLGLLLTARHSVHTETEQDRETAIRMLEEAVAAPNLAKLLRSSGQIQLGQLYLSRMLTFFQTPGWAVSLVTGQAPPEVGAQADRAVGYLRQVLDEGPPSADVAEMAKAMLALAEAVQMTTRGAAGGLDMGRVMEAMASMQNLQARFARGAGPGQGFRGTAGFLSFADIQMAMNLDPLDRPVTVVEQPVEQAVELESRPAPPAEPAPIDRAELRRSLHDKISGTGATQPIWAVAAALIVPGAPALAVDVVDEVVALARMVVDTEDTEGGDAGSVAVDWFVLAVALCLRDRLDQDGDHTDRLTGAESLLAAVRKVPVGHPAAVAMLRALGAFLDEDRPFGGVLDVVAEGFADRLDAVITAGAVTDAANLATLHALRCLCRAAGAVSELGRAAVPPDYPWQGALKAAARAAG